MEKAVQKHLKIAIVGPESSGKSTLAKELSMQLRGHYIEEFARLYLEQHGSKYTIKDLDFFAENQLNLEEQHTDKSILFCDTNPLSIKVWSLYKYQQCSSRIIQLTNSSHYDLNLLLKPDLPYEFDSLREDSPQKNRDELFELFERELINQKSNYSIIEGVGKNRLNNALEVIQSQFSF